MKKISKFIIPVLAALSPVCLLAQPINKSTPDKMLKSAQEAESTNNPYAALELYEETYDATKDKTLSPKIAKLNYDVRDYAAAERGFAKLVLRDRKGEHTELLYWYAMSLKANGKHQEAIDVFNQYIAGGADEKLKMAAKREISGSELARKAKVPDNLIIANGGKKLNSPQTEGSPYYSSGELYFAGITDKKVVVLDGKEGDWYSKIQTATKTANSTEFGAPVALGTNINREGYHQGNVSLTTDGKTMYFTRVELDNMAIKTSKIYVSNKGSDGWGAASEVSGVNGEFIAQHPCEGELFGEKVLFFVANLPGGKGGTDLYYAPKKGDGMFDLPVNLEALNTPENEVTPFYRDGKLYFSSNGRASFGGLDVYESQWNGAVWSEPRNLGAGINTTLDDQYYTQLADGMSGFLVSNRPGPNNLKSKTCCDDIYSWEIERIKVQLLANTFRRKRKGEDKNQPLTECTVQVFDVTDKNPANVDEKANPAANNFDFTLLPEKSYMVVAMHDGYIGDTVKFSTVGVKKSIKVEKDLTLRLMPKPVVFDTLRMNEPIRLNKIYYDFDDDKILAESEPDLQFLTDLMKKYPEIKIELSSHTDAQGKDDYNEKLSQRRANSAAKWITERGIAADRIVPVGYGEKVILNRCTNGVECTDDEHRFNRRTEFKIIAGPTTITTERIEKREPKKPEGQKTNGQKPGGKQSVPPVFFYQN